LPPASAGFLLDLPFNPEDGGDMFLQNIRLSPDYLALQPRRLCSSWSPTSDPTLTNPVHLTACDISGRSFIHSFAKNPSQGHKTHQDIDIVQCHNIKYNYKRSKAKHYIAKYLDRILFLLFEVLMTSLYIIFPRKMISSNNLKWQLGTKGVEAGTSRVTEGLRDSLHKYLLPTCCPCFQTVTLGLDSMRTYLRRMGQNPIIARPLIIINNCFHHSFLQGQKH
jgi:hypothetical protein